MAWLRTLGGMQPELELLSATEKLFNGFASSFLCNETVVQNFHCEVNSQILNEATLGAEQLERCLEQHLASAHDSWNFFFINKFIVRDRAAEAPPNANKLRISPASFKQIVQTFDIPASFVDALSTHYLPHGQGHHQISSVPSSDSYGHWYLLPVRVQFACTDQRSGHVASASNSNQMNPYHYVHLPDMEVDVRGFCIAIYANHDSTTGNSNFVVFNFAQGRWAKVVEEPQKRVAGAIAYSAKNGQKLSPYFLHLVYLTSVSRWWTNVMSSVYDQLIAYEEGLQEQFDSDNESTHFYAKLDRALHCVAAHLQRYRSELNSLEATIADISQLFKKKHGASDNGDRRFTLGLAQTASQVKATSDFCQELEKKLSNILALLFNRMQISNTRALNVVLQAIQTDTETSQRLTEETRKDSLSMKTVLEPLTITIINYLFLFQIAVVTMFFLPGATIAALLSMPFMDNVELFKSIKSIWLWFALTIPTTTCVFMFYWYCKRRSDRRAEETERDQTQ